MEREAAAFDEEAVKMAMAEKAAKKEAEEMAEKLGTPKFTGCPGSMARAIERKSVNTDNSAVGGKIESELRQWPVQIKLAPIRAPYFDGAIARRMRTVIFTATLCTTEKCSSAARSSMRAITPKS